MVETGLPLIFVNQVGGQDELVFDGGSFGLNADRTLAFQMPLFETGLVLTRWEQTNGGWRCVDGPMATLPSDDAANWRACVLGLRDYVDKNGFRGVVLGLSGGIDSALCAAMAVDALGRGARPRDHAALPLHRAGQPDRRRGLRDAARHSLRRRSDRAGGRRLFRALEPLFANRSATSPKRTSSRGRAARS